MACTLGVNWLFRKNWDFRGGRMIFFIKNSSPTSKLILFTVYLFLFTFSFWFLSCEKSTAPLENKTPNISLEIDEVDVTEAWLNLQTENLLDKDVLQVYRNDSIIYTGKPGPADTNLYDNGLLPAQSYSYHASLTRNNQVISETSTKSITTMDTTGHNFQWSTYTFGGSYGSSDLRDVAIINENDIWAVGEVYADSAQPSKRYNAVHWDGVQWYLQRITVSFRNSNITPPGEGIYAYSSNDIWVTLGGAPAHWDGSNWTLFHLWDMGVLTQNDGGVTRIWGSSQDNIYFTGRGGTIVHYENQSWQKLNSGTDLNIKDIWGGVNPFTGKTEILAIASSWPQSLAEVKLLRIENYLVYPVSVTGLPIAMTNIWFMPGKRYYLAGDGLYYTRKLGETWKRDPNLPLIFKTGIRGHGVNDVFIVGSFGLVSHFNGMSWHHYMGNELPSFSGGFNQMDYKGNIMVAIGDIGSDALILMGRKR
jgi:hypothetical protein